jgi:hypothetical protein
LRSHSPHSVMPWRRSTGLLAQADAKVEEHDALRPAHRPQGRVRLRRSRPCRRDPQRTAHTVDNVRRTIVDASVERANGLLAARDQLESRGARRTRCAARSPRSWPSSTCRDGGRCISSATPTRPSRCASTSRSSTWGRAACGPSRSSSDARSTRPSHCFPAGGFWQPIGDRPTTIPPSPVRAASWKARKRPNCSTFFEAAEGTRTLDLLHGKQTFIQPLGPPFACKAP